MNKTKTFLYSIIALGLTATSCTTTAKEEPTTNTKEEPTTDTITKPTINPTTVSDIDGNIYHTVTIGTQTWLVENLKTTKYRNGDSIETTHPSITIINPYNTDSKYQWAYDGEKINVDKYGRLYTWYAVNDSRNIAPIGWHVATDAEWTTLETYVTAHSGTSLNTAKALASTTDWNTGTSIDDIGNNLSINNYSGFNALPGGSRVAAGWFGYLGNSGCWWSSSVGYADKAWGRNLNYYNSIGMIRIGNEKRLGLSVRCIRDSQ
jgi:uncharacterized protein (TIGR02145 family)